MQALFRRAQLKALVDIHSQTEGMGGYLGEEELAVIRGALDLTEKQAAASMTPLEKARPLLVKTTTCRIQIYSCCATPACCANVKLGFVTRACCLTSNLFEHTILLSPVRQVRPWHICDSLMQTQRCGKSLMATC